MTELSLLLWQKFALSALIGLLVGLEREHTQQATERAFSFAGIRTFPLIALLGSTLAMISDHQPALFTFGFIGLMALLLIVYTVSTRHGDTGLTTEIAVLLVYLIGGLIYWDHIWLATALGVLVTGLLALRNTLHTLVARIEREDIYATLKFIIISAVVLPLLPNRTFDPLHVLNPFQLWLMVVFVSAISFSGYLAIKLFGRSRGIWITSLLGGVVSTTALTLSFAERSRAHPSLVRHLAAGIVIASSTMYLRVLVEVLAFNPSLAGEVWGRLLLPFAVGLVSSLYLWRTTSSDESIPSDFNNPFRLWPAIQIGLLFGAILFLTTLANQALGEIGTYLASFLSGLTKIDPITLSLSQMAGREITRQVAVQALLLATGANILGKIILLLLAGSAALRRQALLPLALMAASSLVVAAF